MVRTITAQDKERGIKCSNGSEKVVSSLFTGSL